MKSNLKIIFFYALLFLFVQTIAADVVSGDYGKNIHWTFDKASGVLTFSGKGEMTNDKSVPKDWNNFRLRIKKIIITNGITSINDRAFENCKNTTDITIPPSVKRIGKSVFEGCVNLSGVYITDLSAWCKMEMQTLPLNYANKLFVNGKILTDLVIPDDITELGLCFKNCTSITSVTIPKNMKKMHSSAFEGCSNLTHVIWNAKSVVSQTGYYSPLYYCLSSQLTNITFGKEVQSIQPNLCYNMAKLTSVVIPDGVNSIGDDAFNGCTNLSSITIAPSVKYIGRRVFYGCKNLSAIKISDLSAWCKIEYPTNGTYSVHKNGKKCEGNYTDSENLPLYYAHNLYLNDKLLTDLQIPKDITSIESSFRYCTSIKSVTLHENIQRMQPGNYNIDYGSFAFCSNLSKVIWNVKKYEYDEAPWTKDNKKTITSFTFGSNVEEIPAKCCQGMSEISSINIPASVKVIKNEAFDGCKNLSAVHITDLMSWCKIIQNSHPLFYAGNLYLNNKLVADVQWPTTMKQVGTAYRYCTCLKKVIISEGVSSIGKFAFEGCWNLQSVSVPSTIQSIGEKAFSGCTGLMYVDIPNTIQYIEEYAFEDVPNLEYYSSRISGAPWGARSLNGTIINGVVYSDENATSLRACPSTYKGDIIIPSSVRQINSYAFLNCDSLKAVRIDNLNDWFKISFGNNSNPLAFAHKLIVRDTLLTELHVPSIKAIPDNAFYGCTSLKKVKISNGVERIGKSAFYGCSNLQSVKFPTNSIKIDDCAFDNCKNLIVHVPSNVNLSNSSYFHCFSNVPLVICDKTRQGAPWGAQRMEDGGWIENGIIYKDSTKTVIKKCLTSVSGDVVLPQTVTKIEAFAFRDCSHMTSISISPTLKEVGDSAFYNCRRLSAVHISDIDAWSQIYFDHTSVSNPLYYANNLYLNNQLVREVKLSDRVMKIGQFAFANCRSLCRINIPKSVKTIGWGAFCGCSNLINVSIPEGVSIIDGATFWKCVNLKSVTISNSITTIGRSAFYDCSALTSVTIPNSVTSIGNYAFSDCSVLTSVTIPNSVTSIGEGAFYGCSALTSVTIPNSVTSIGEWAFARVNNITYSGSATGQPWRAKSINGYVDGYFVYKDSSKKELLGCNSDVKGHITIPNSVTSIGDDAFRSCTALTSITIPNSVTSIGKQAFNGCTALTSVTIPNSVTSIGEHAFNQVNNIINFCNASGARWGAKCENGFVDGNLVYKDSSKKELEGCSSYVKGHITIPNSVISIGGFAFYGCSTLTSVTIPNSVTSIGEWAFYGCSALTSVTIPNSVTSIGNRAFSDCSALTSVTIMKRSSSIQMDYQSVFRNCSKLHTLYIPSTIELPKGLDPTIEIINIQKDSSRLEMIPHSLKIDDPNRNGKVDVDEACAIRFTIYNKGKGDAVGCKVKVKTDDEYPFLHLTKAKELPNIPAGESVNVELPLFTDKNAATLRIPLQISVTEIQGDGISPFTIPIQLTTFAPPQLQVEYSLYSSTSIAQKTEPIIVKMFVRNIGVGIARDVSCSVSLPKTLQHLSGSMQHEWDVIYAGEQKEFSFKLNSTEGTLDSLSVDYVLKEKYGLYASSGYIPIVWNKTETYKKEMSSKLTYSISEMKRHSIALVSGIRQDWCENNPMIKEKYALIRIKLIGMSDNKEIIKQAKKDLRWPKDRINTVPLKTDYDVDNAIFLLVPISCQWCDLSCGDGCEPIKIWNYSQDLVPNGVYDVTITVTQL